MNQAIKRRILILVTILVVLFIGHWVWRTSTIEIKISSGNNGSVGYSLLNQTSRTAVSGTTNSTVIKKRVLGSIYEVSIVQNGKSYFALVKTRGFLRKSVVTATLQQQKGRQFVGNNPASCSQYINGVLVSYNCGDFYGNIKIHVPATSSTPTYAVTQPGTGIAGYVQGFVNLNGKVWTLIQHPQRDTQAYDSIDQVNNDLSVASEIRLPDLNSGITYSIQNYRDGFLIYSSDFSQLLYYASPTSQSQTIKLLTPTVAGLHPAFLDASTSSILAVYSPSAATPMKNSKTEVIIMGTDGHTKNLIFNGNYTSGRMCGLSSLCIVGGNNLIVYDTSATKPHERLTIDNVASTLLTPSGFLVVNKTGVLNLNVNDGSGFYEFVFGDYEFNNIYKTDGGYTLSLSNNKSNRVALFINQSLSNTDDIDKKIEQLQKYPEIDSVSTYGNFIYISPNLGQLSYQPLIQGYGYSPTTINNVNSQINADIKRVGINTSTYKISNPYE